jgi:hypothetical protein
LPFCPPFAPELDRIVEQNRTGRKKETFELSDGRIITTETPIGMPPPFFGGGAGNIGKTARIAKSAGGVADDLVGGAAKVIRTWPKHHPFPVYLGGAIDQTLKKIPLKLHQKFHAALDKWKGGIYDRRLGSKSFLKMDKEQVIKDLREFYETAEDGAFKKYLCDFEQAVKESGH